MKKIKKSYIKLYGYLSFIFIIFLLNVFMSNILNSYKLVLILILLVAIFQYFFVFEKSKKRYNKPVIYLLLSCSIVYLCLFYLSGLIIGFTKTGNYLNWYGLKTFIIPTILIIVLKEYLRYGISLKSEGNKALLIFAVITFVMMDISSVLAFYVKGVQDLFLLYALNLLPAISNNILCFYIVRKTNYKPSIVYMLIMNLYKYIIPIVPNPTEYIKSMIDFIVPLLFLIRLNKFFVGENDEYIERNYNKNIISNYAFPIILSAVLIYFISGYFKYYALTIGSGSMEPNIKVGDVVIVKQKGYEVNDIQIGTVIVYRHNNVQIVHRVVDIVKSDNDYIFYTKGDNNDIKDSWYVEEKDIIGIATYKLPYIGLPTVWLSKRN